MLPNLDEFWEKLQTANYLALFSGNHLFFTKIYDQITVYNSKKLQPQTFVVFPKNHQSLGARASLTCRHCSINNVLRKSFNESGPLKPERNALLVIVVNSSLLAHNTHYADYNGDCGHLSNTDSDNKLDRHWPGLLISSSS